MAKPKKAAKQSEPISSRMEQVLALFERGDTSSARRLARQVVAGPEQDSERIEAQAFLARTGFPRPALYIAVVPGILILAMLVLALARG